MVFGIPRTWAARTRFDGTTIPPMGPRRRGRVALGCALGLLVLPAAAHASKDPSADWFTLATPALDAGQIELLTVSTLPDAVSGGEVLVGVRGLAKGDRLKLAVNGARAKRTKPSPRQ